MKARMKRVLCLGLMGCVCFGAGDWLMIFGDTAHQGSLYWLTDGAMQIAPWRNGLAMALAFPGILFYGVALFAVSGFIVEERPRKIYRILTAFGLTPWLCLHLFYIMILYLFAWLNANGYAQAALPAAEALYRHLSWIVIVSEAMMLPPFLYWFFLQITKKTVFPRRMALTNVLILYGLLYIVRTLLPDSPFRLGFTNGLMSESMILWFAAMLPWTGKLEEKVVG